MITTATDRPVNDVRKEIPVKKLKQLWQTQKTRSEIAFELCITLKTLKLLETRYNLPPKSSGRRAGRKNFEKEVDPTPEEIIARAAEVRERWSARDFARSMGYRGKDVEVRLYSFDRASVSFSDVTQ